MKRLAVLALILGLVVFTLVIARQGIQGVLALFAHGGWWLLLLLPIHAVPLLPDVLSWRALIIGSSGVVRLYWIAAVRQGVSRLLPAAGIGGELVGIRLLRRTGVSVGDAAASVVMEVLITLVSEYLFIMLGIVCLLSTLGSVHVVHMLVIGMSVSLPVIALMGAIVRHGALFERLQSFALAMFGRLLREQSAARRTELQGGAQIDAAIRAICRSNSRLARAVGWQCVAMLSGCLETWAAFWILGASVTLPQVVALESLVSAARHILFIVPAGLGVQELSFVALGHLLGISGEVSVALSLTKRLTQILFGVPALLSWQWAEGRRWWGGTDTGRIL